MTHAGAGCNAYEVYLHQTGIFVNPFEIQDHLYLLNLLELPLIYIRVLQKYD